MTRLGLLAVSACLLFGCGRAESRPVRLAAGPQLFVDGDLIAESSGVRRVVEPPLPRDAPIVTGRGDANSTPYVSVDRGPAGFRLWYDRRADEPGPLHSHIGYLTSRDGVTWKRPARTLADPAPITFGVSVFAGGRRLAWWHDGAMWLARSSDGERWTAARAVLPGVRDIVSVARDGLRRRWVATFKLESTPDENSPAYRRLVGMSTSTDLARWSAPRTIFARDAGDPPRLEFYGLGGVVERGGLLIGFLRVLRDDEPADPGGEPDGIGYTVLAWSRDGEHWHRDRVPFLDRDHRPGSWDHAMAWADAQVTVGDRTLVYYGGYDAGHKTNRYTGRQLGVATMGADRYVARRARAGRLTTRLLRWAGSRLRVNAVVDGALTVRVRDSEGHVLRACRVPRGDSIGRSARCDAGLRGLAGRVVRLEFAMRDVALYGFRLT